jgi:ectoine hydroxylase-related dioxygenase (phytanoyl-CoA dioxygenase family)
VSENIQDYMFDLQGYLVLENAISEADLREINRWIDDHWAYVEEPWAENDDSRRKSRWLGNIETHTYNVENGVNFQNIIEGGSVFERLIDHPAWTKLVQKYIHSSVNGLSIHENFLNVRGPGGYIHIHCGGHVPLSYLTFRQVNTGEWMVGQINVLMALNDIGPGDGPPVLVPGSHKCTEIHPRLKVDGKGLVYDGVSGKPAGTAIATKEMYLKAGDVLMFTDAITHGSAERTNPGYRRTIVYRYSPKFVRERFNYPHSHELLERLTPERRKIIQPNEPRRPEYDGVGV